MKPGDIIIVVGYPLYNHDVGTKFYSQKLHKNIVEFQKARVITIFSIISEGNEEFEHDIEYFYETMTDIGRAKIYRDDVIEVICV